MFIFCVLHSRLFCAIKDLLTCLLSHRSKSRFTASADLAEVIGGTAATRDESNDSVTLEKLLEVALHGVDERFVGGNLKLAVQKRLHDTRHTRENNAQSQRVAANDENAQTSRSPQYLSLRVTSSRAIRVGLITV